MRIFALLLSSKMRLKNDKTRAFFSPRKNTGQLSTWRVPPQKTENLSVVVI
jgi:hypothetical protein|tara:strand:+ start:229 stop:381 length:153 start_codon:yes stop_codon:yes gene_type:complete